MPIQVELPDGVAEFPDNMQPSEIQEVLNKRFQSKIQQKPSDFKAITGAPKGESDPLAGVSEPPPQAWEPTVNRALTEQYLRTGGQRPESGMESGTEFTQALYEGWKTPIAKVLPDVPGPLRRSMQSRGAISQRALGTYEGIADTLNSLTSPESISLLAGIAGAATASKLLPSLIGMVFAGQMGKNISVDLAQELGAELGKPEAERDQSKISNLISRGIAETLMVGAIGKELVPKGTEPVTTPEGKTVYQTPSQLPPTRLGMARLWENLRNLAGAPTGLPRPRRVPVVAPPVPPLPHQTGTTQQQETYAREVGETAPVYGAMRPQPIEGAREVPVEEGGPRVQPQAAQALPEVLTLQPAIQGIRPAIRTLDNELLIGKQGETHNDIIARHKLKPEDIDRRAFADARGNELSREQVAAMGVPQEGPTQGAHSTELAQVQAGRPPEIKAPEAAPPAPIKPPEKPTEAPGGVQVAPALEKPLPEAKTPSKPLSPDVIGWDQPFTEPPYRPITDAEAADPATLGRIATKDWRIGGAQRKESLTNRLLVLQNLKDGTVHVVSTYKHGRVGPVALDPERVGTKYPNRQLATITPRYKPLYSILTTEPVQNFHQRFDSLADYQAKFGERASQGLSQRMAAPVAAAGRKRGVEAPEEVAGFTGYAQGAEPAQAPAVYGPELETVPTDAELSQAFQILKPISGTATPEVIARRFNELAQTGKGTIGQRQVLSAVKKIAQKFVDDEGISPEDAIAKAIETLHETAKQSASPQAFSESILSGFPERAGKGIEAQAPAVPKAKVAISPSPERPLGIVAPQSVANLQAAQAMMAPIESLGRGIRDFWRSFTMQAMPKTTAAHRVTGEAGVRYGAAPYVARSKGMLFAEKVMDDLKDPAFDRKFGTALTEDNLRSVRRDYERAGDPDAAAKVATVIGSENSPFTTEKQYQDFLADPRTQEAIARHKQLWEEEKDPIFRRANDLDPEAELASRGLQTGARINLKNVMPGEGTRTTIGPASKLPLIRQTATLLRRDPFARRATGAGKSYEGSYSEIMAHAYEREYPVAAQHDFINSLLESGLGMITDRESPPGLSINGEPTKGYLMKLRPWRGKFLQLPRSVAGEFEAVSGLSPTARIPYYTAAGEFLTRQSVQGLAEGSTHIANILQKTFLGLGPTPNPMLNALLKAAGRSDLLITLPRTFMRAFENRREDMLKLAEIGAAKTPYAGNIGWIINKIDQGVRLNSASVYDGLADAGWVVKTETGKREFINQVGNYNRRLQPALIRWLRDTKVQPFATAHQTYLGMGLREMALGPAAKATSLPAAAALRIEKAAGIMGALVIIGALNYLTSKNVFGPKGTELGSVGWIGDDKRLHQFSISKLTGMDRGFRQTGIKGAVEAARLGLPLQQQVKAGVQGAAQTAVQTIAGPATQFAVKAVTGKRPGVPMVQEAKIVPPQAPGSFNILKTQMAENLKTAIQEANPAVDAIMSARQGKSIEEILQRQFSRYTPRTGLPESTIQALPKIVRSGDIKAYADQLAKDSRKQPKSQRRAYVNKRMTDDGVQSQDRKSVLREVQLKGTFKYQ